MTLALNFAVGTLGELVNAAVGYPFLRYFGIILRSTTNANDLVTHPMFKLRNLTRFGLYEIER